MGILFSEGAIIREGPLSQTVNRDIPSKTKGSSGSDSLLEVRFDVLVFQLNTVYFCLFLVSFMVGGGTYQLQLGYVGGSVYLRKCKLIQ